MRKWRILPEGCEFLDKVWVFLNDYDRFGTDFSKNVYINVEVIVKWNA